MSDAIESSNLNRFRSQMMRRLSRSKELRDAVATVDNSGNRSIVFALASERLATLVKRVELTGGYATVFVEDKDRVAVLSFMDPNCVLDLDSAQDLANVPDDQLPSANASVGVFLDFLTHMPQGLIFRLRADLPTPVVSAPHKVLASSEA